MPHYAIGDVQGCYTELMQLLKKIEFDESKDTLWFAGDIINGGNENLAVLRFLYQLSQESQNKPIIVLGNHDLHYLAVFYHVREIQVDDTFQDILSAPDTEPLTFWLQSQSLAYYEPTFNALMIHAGILPHWTLEKTLTYAKEIERCLKDPQNMLIYLRSIFGISQKKEALHWRLITDTLTRARFCDKNGDLDLVYKGNIFSAPKKLYPWFQLSPLTCDILFGHWAALEGKVTGVKNIYPLDTGCVWGGKLTALRLEDKKYFQVTGKKYR
jgi:bis(5'-nucleosyl)-tetraphosphatase (symmetrical)